jgi:NosR/NirI family transcriptional regulator, nitrous oxide reductase regulator
LDISQHPTPNTQQPTPNTQQPTTNTQYPIANNQHPTPNTQQPTTNTQYPIANNQHPTPNTQLKKTIHIIVGWIIVMMALGFADAGAQQQRFPKPEFETGYQLPDTSTPEPRDSSMELVDLMVLLGVLGFTTWLALKKRSRKWILWTSVFALLYFGFYRNGCICSIGAIQNLALALFSSEYAISLTVLGFLVVPLFTALAVGRIFCASACPLGVIQDLVIVKPIRLAPWLQKALGLFPFIYLGLAVLYAATGTDFIICRYDPFVGIFRLGAEFHMIVLGISFLLIGMFVARPYCRFICPYGALLNISSRFSKNHLTITPEECIQCKLCKGSCPFDAIDYPTDEKENRVSRTDYRKFLLYAALIPLLMVGLGWGVSASHKLLSKAHPDVYLANLLVARPDLMQSTDNLDIETFMASGKTLDMLVEEASVIQQQFRRGGWYLGAFIGLVIGLTLLNQVVFRRRTIYEPNRGGCYSCGRCMEYCPVGKPDHPYFQEGEGAIKAEEKENTDSLKQK